MKSSLFRLLALLSAMLLPPGSALAQIVISQGANAPTANVFFKQEIYGSSYAWNGLPTARRDVGQSFLAPSSESIGAITMRISSFNTGAPSAPFTIKIFETDTYNQALTSADLISTQTGTLPASLEALNYITFRLADDVAITGGKYYTFMFNYDSLASGRALSFAMGDNLSFPGDRWTSADGTTYSRNGNEYKFTFYVTAAPVPEGKPLSLLGIGGVILLLTTRNAAAKRAASWCLR